MEQRFLFWFRLNILCRVTGYRGHVVRRDLRCGVFRLGKRIQERCVAPMGMLIILADGTRGQGLGLNLGSRDGCHQGLYRQGGEVGSGSRFLGRRNRFGRSGARSPGRPICRFQSGPASPPPSSRRRAPLGSRFSGCTWPVAPGVGCYPGQGPMAPRPRLHPFADPAGAAGRV